jgi:hypothetical protein
LSFMSASLLEQENRANAQTGARRKMRRNML